jgi:hypothetical protein
MIFTFRDVSDTGYHSLFYTILQILLPVGRDTRMFPDVPVMFLEVRTEACLWQVCFPILMANGIVLSVLLLIASFTVHMGSERESEIESEHLGSHNREPSNRPQSTE